MDAIRAGSDDDALGDAIERHSYLPVVYTPPRDLGDCEIHPVADPHDPDPAPVPAAELVVCGIRGADPSTVHVCPGCLHLAVFERTRDARLHAVAIEVPTGVDLRVFGIRSNLDQRGPADRTDEGSPAYARLIAGLVLPIDTDMA